MNSSLYVTFWAAKLWYWARMRYFYSYVYMIELSLEQKQEYPSIVFPTNNENITTDMTLWVMVPNRKEIFE